MADISTLHHKTGTQLLFNIDAHWQFDTSCVFYSNDIKGMIKVSSSPKLSKDEEEGKWSPEYIFLGSIASSFMTTYLNLAKQADLQLTNFECNVIGQMIGNDGAYEFVNIHLYPKIFIAKESLKEKANSILADSIKNCPVINSVKAKTMLHPEVLIDLHPKPIY